MYDSHSGEQDSDGGGYIDHPIVHINPLQTALDPEGEADANEISDDKEENSFQQKKTMLNLLDLETAAAPH